MSQSIDKQLFQDIRLLIEQGKKEVAIQVNSAMTMVFWQVGKRINEEVLDNQRAEYGKEVVATLSQQLSIQYGRSFESRNLRRMMQFADVFPEIEIVVPLARQLSWSHFIILIPIKEADKRAFYAQKSIEAGWGKRELRKQIERKVFERKEIAKAQLSPNSSDIHHTFKDPYFLDFLGLKDGYLENDLEAAILKDLEQFILELGMGFTFVDRQKRMIIDGEDFYLDLLFYHRKLRRLVAIELKIGKFKAAYKGQMELYLKWLAKHDRQEGEELPVGLILCAEASSEQIKLLEMHKDGIMVAEYWTELPPKKQLEEKIHMALVAARERIVRGKLS